MHLFYRSVQRGFVGVGRDPNACLKTRQLVSDTTLLWQKLNEL